MRRINLLPWRDERRQKLQRNFVVHLVSSVVVALAIGGGIHLYMQDQLDFQDKRNNYLNDVIKDLDRKIQSINELKKKKNELIARMQVIEKLQSSRPIVVHLMEDFVKTLPDGIQLTKIDITGDKKISLQGYADAQARVADYLRQLNGSDYISNAVIVGSGILAHSPGKDAPSSNRYVFSITASVKTPKSTDGSKEQ
ncbi:PilN domain-containing protein [Halothiobacillus sp.]|jgi:type IV pilus assembly protein PilN|uniref:PilN domain-containing protein n=1 Tax=Halothiobacillus sp. TaxID=1891311 RepID=UPI002AD3CC5D|nr:PilN domain-containing protein [Halothiobacillus sp.]